MAKNPSAQAQPSPAGSAACPPPAGIPVFTEPEVRRWPHPVTETLPPPCPPSSGGPLAQICCALTRQNQLLAEIKALLEHPAADLSTDRDEK